MSQKKKPSITWNYDDYNKAEKVRLVSPLRYWIIIRPLWNQMRDQDKQLPSGSGNRDPPIRYYYIREAYRHNIYVHVDVDEPRAENITFHLLSRWLYWNWDDRFSNEFAPINSQAKYNYIIVNNLLSFQGLTSRYDRPNIREIIVILCQILLWFDRLRHKTSMRTV